MPPRPRVESKRGRGENGKTWGIITCPRSQSHRHPRLSVGVWADYKHVKRNKERARNARKWLLNPIQGEIMMYQFEVIAGHLTIVDTSNWDFMFGFRKIIKKLER